MTETHRVTLKEVPVEEGPVTGKRRSLKIRPLSLGDKAMGVLYQIRDGRDIYGASDADYLRDIDKRFPGIIKILPPTPQPPYSRKAPSIFFVRCTPKGKRLITNYLMGVNNGA